MKFKFSKLESSEKVLWLYKIFLPRIFPLLENNNKKK